MDAIFRRSSGRIPIPGITALFVLAVFSILFISFPASGGDAPSQLYRRDILDRGLVRGHGLVWRQEPPAGTTSSTNSTFATPSSNSSTISSTSQSSSSTSSVPTSSTITTTSSSTRSVSSTSTSTSISTTSISSSESESSTSTSATVPVLTVTRTRARSTTTSEPTPETTLIVSDNFLPTFTTTHTSTQSAGSTVTPLAVGATSKGFWANKAAVAAVFVIVSLVILGVGALLIINFLKKRNTARQRLIHSRLFEKYTDSPSPKGSVRGRADVVYDDSRFTGAKVTSEYPFAGSASNAVASSSGAAAAVTAPAPQQQQQQQQYQYQAPPSSSHGSQQTAFYTPNASQQSLSTHEQHNAAAGPFSAFSTNPAPMSAVATTQRTHYMLPSQSQAAAASHYNTASRLAPPVAYRDPTQTQADRTSYQHSIDSFYGGNPR